VAWHGSVLAGKAQTYRENTWEDAGEERTPAVASPAVMPSYRLRPALIPRGRSMSGRPGETSPNQYPRWFTWITPCAPSVRSYQRTKTRIILDLRIRFRGATTLPCVYATDPHSVTWRSPQAESSDEVKVQIADMAREALTDTSAVPSMAPGTRRNRLLDALLLCALLLSCLIFYCVSTQGTWSPLHQQTLLGVAPEGRFFLAQAQAMTHGRLWISQSQLPGDCFIHGGKCYGYFGLTPSLLRLPFLPLLDHFNSGFTPVFITAGLTLATGSFLALLRRLFSHLCVRSPAIVVVALLGMALGAASILTQLSAANTYDEAIAWAVGFLSLAVYYFIRWWETLQRWTYVALVVSLVLAANARPTGLPFALVIGFGVGYRILTLKRNESADWTKSVALGGTAILLPIATCIGVFLLKFGQPIPNLLLDQTIGGRNASPEWIRVRTRDRDHLVSLRFVMTALLAYLRPDAVSFSSAFPWVQFRFVSTLTGPSPISYVALPQGSIYSANVTSLTATMPLSFVAAIGATFYRLRQRIVLQVRPLLPTLRSESFWKIFVVVAALSSWCVTLTGVAVEDRFLGDAYPLMALLLLLGLYELAKPFENAGRLLKIGIVLTVLVGVGWQLLVNIGLARYVGVQ
jgi:hypothetical protein